MTFLKKPTHGAAESIERLLDIRDVAELLSVPVSWIYKHLRAVGTERLPGIRLGKYWRFRESEIHRWLESHRA